MLEVVALLGMSKAENQLGPFLVCIVHVLSGRHAGSTAWFVGCLGIMCLGADKGHLVWDGCVVCWCCSIDTWHVLAAWSERTQCRLVASSPLQYMWRWAAELNGAHWARQAVRLSGACCGISMHWLLQLRVCNLAQKSGTWQNLCRCWQPPNFLSA
jgi:hypothetical protein